MQAHRCVLCERDRERFVGGWDSMAVTNHGARKGSVRCHRFATEPV